MPCTPAAYRPPAWPAGFPGARADRFDGAKSLRHWHQAHTDYLGIMPGGQAQWRNLARVIVASQQAVDTMLRRGFKLPRGASQAQRAGGGCVAREGHPTLSTPGSRKASQVSRASGALCNDQCQRHGVGQCRGRQESVGYCILLPTDRWRGPVTLNTIAMKWYRTTVVV